MIDTRTGKKFRYLTTDSYLNLSPAWSPDGRYIVYASYRGKKPVSVAPSRDGGTVVPGHVRSEDWYLVRVDTKTGQHRVLTSAADSPAFSPVYSPDGTQIAFIGLTRSPDQPDIYVMPADGGPPQPLQVTLVTKELSLDWR